MATKLFLRGVTGTGAEAADTHLGNNSVRLDSSTLGSRPYSLLSTAGTAVQTASTGTVTGPTAGIEIGSVATREWISPPVSADVSISGAITGNLWASESDMNANVAINFVVDVIRATNNSIVQIVKSARVIEAAITTRAVNNFTATPGAAVTVNRGDRMRLRVFGDDAGTMATGFTFAVSWGGGTAAADGDSYISFTETFSFESAPAGSVIYLTNTASDVATASVDREAWTSRGAGVVDDVVNSVTGWTASIQFTDTAGGTVVDWFTKQLQAFTLGGMVKGNLRFTSASSNTTSAKLEIARVDSNGTNPTVWGIWCLSPIGSASPLVGNLHTAERAETFYCSGDDLVFTNGQRIRIRVYIDDCFETAMQTGFTATLFYAGTSAAASGDSYVILPQTVSEFTGTAVVIPEILKAPMIPAGWDTF